MAARVSREVRRVIFSRLAYIGDKVKAEMPVLGVLSAIGCGRTKWFSEEA